MTKALIGFSFVCLVAVSSYAQTRVIALRTNWPAARVYADSEFLGTADQSMFTVPHEARSIRLIPPEQQAGRIEPLYADLTDLPDTTEIRMDFPYYYRIDTVPFDASVSIDSAGKRTIIGVTPLVQVFPKPLRNARIVVERPGFQPQEIEPGDEIWNSYSMVLKPFRLGSENENEVNWRPPSRSHQWIDYAAVGLAVVSGLATVHYKFKADRRYDLYRENGDTSLRSEVRKYDTRAAVALAGMQVGVGVFALRLVLR